MIYIAWLLDKFAVFIERTAQGLLSFITSKPWKKNITINEAYFSYSKHTNLQHTNLVIFLNQSDYKYKINLWLLLQKIVIV